MAQPITTFFFMWPPKGFSWSGKVYEVHRDALDSGLIQLPTGETLGVSESSSDPEHPELQLVAKGPSGRLYPASLVFDARHLEIEFTGDWDEALRILEAADALVVPAQILISDEERDRLNAGNGLELEALRAKMSESLRKQCVFSTGKTHVCML